MLYGMNRTGLAARIGYGLGALALTGTVGFYASVWLLPWIGSKLPGADTDADGYGFFVTALGIGLGVGLTFGLIGLTLPWMRRKRRSGRSGRIAISSAIVVIASAVFATQGHAFPYDMLFAAWLSYVLAFTYVRYGILDKTHKREGTSAGTPRATDVAG